jgi:hypothetical protein
MKILAGCPIHESKDYCFSKFIKGLLNQKLPDKCQMDIVLIDNSPDYNKHYKYLQWQYPDIDFSQFTILHEKQTQNKYATITKCQNKLRKYAIKNAYDYFWSVENDIIVENKYLHQLLSHNLYVVGGLYHIGFSYTSGLMVQVLKEPLIGDEATVEFMHPFESFYMIDGKLKPIMNIGLGCLLIHKHILEQITFRIPEENMSSDIMFARDIYDLGYQNFADTSIICHHLTDAGFIKNIKPP